MNIVIIAKNLKEDYYIEALMGVMESSLDEGQYVSVGLVMETELGHPVVYKSPALKFIHPTETLAVLRIFRPRFLIAGISVSSEEYKSSMVDLQPYVLNDRYIFINVLNQKKETVSKDKRLSLVSALWDIVNYALVRQDLKTKLLINALNEVKCAISVMYEHPTRRVFFIRYVSEEYLKRRNNMPYDHILLSFDHEGSSWMLILGEESLVNLGLKRLKKFTRGSSKELPGKILVHIKEEDLEMDVRLFPELK
ncbi:MAG: hypothetical protein DRN30_06160 [Thermoplasmata archaeon]|nr:MAG: hypothetical protein DRN30_06160 [Thermoplasmata archaeon]